MDTWGVRKTVGAISVAVAVAGVGGAAIAAATGAGSHASMGGFGGFDGPGGPGAPRPDHQMDAEPAALHGEYVLADGGGGYATEVVQTGRITAISSTSVTARSDDGFVQTYARDVVGTAVSAFDTGDLVTIKARRVGEATTVSTMEPPLPLGR